jgi:hypothetical protein
VYVRRRWRRASGFVPGACKVTGMGRTSALDRSGGRPVSLSALFLLPLFSLSPLFLLSLPLFYNLLPLPTIPLLRCIASLVEVRALWARWARWEGGSAGFGGGCADQTMGGARGLAVPRGCGGHGGGSGG